MSGRERTWPIDFGYSLANLYSGEVKIFISYFGLDHQKALFGFSGGLVRPRCDYFRWPMETAF